MIHPNTIEDVKAAARIEDVVGQFVQLSQRGASRKGDACPFCGDPKKFGVSVAKQLYKCHACGEGGSGPVAFLMHNAGKRTGMDFPTAITWLADYYHIEVRRTESDAAGTGGAFDTTYFDDRMLAIGYDAQRDPGLFVPRSDGGIAIRFPSLYADGPQWQQYKGAPFERVRLHPERATSKQKYHQAEGSGIRIFIPPVVVAEWRAGVKWPTLFIVEGEIKAYTIARPGVPVVGITGIKMYMERKGSKNLHADLVQLLRNTTAVCLVHDADALTLKWEPLSDPHKDLGTRARDFASAVTGFRGAVGTLVPHVHYVHVAQDWAEKAKGLDDLAIREGVDRVTERLIALRSGAYFQHHDISKMEWRAINGIFNLNIHGGVPKAFYNAHADLIGERAFVWLGGRYQCEHNEETGERKLQMLEHPESKNYLIVGTEFYRRQWKPRPGKDPVPTLDLWKESFLMRDYVRNGVPRFIHTLDRYSGFYTLPGHHDAFQEVITVQPDEWTSPSRYLNKYAPLDIKPKKGTYPTIEGYLKHVFGTHKLQTIDPKGNVLAESEAWEVYLDRWTIMYRQPMELLPACVLASEQHNTGKTTLLKLNLIMWGDNAIMIGNEALTDGFNSDWAERKYVGVDETFVEQKKEGEKMKSRITSPTVAVRGMYKDRETRVNFTTFDLTTNNPDRFLPVGGDDYRYWVNIVPQYTVEDPFLLDKMVAELPALFADLATRKVIHPKMGRLWFANSVIETEARKAAAKESRPWIERELEAWVVDQFYAYQWPELYFTVTQIMEGVNQANGARFRRGEFTHILKSKVPCHQEFRTLVVPKLPHLRKGEGQSTPDIGPEVKQRWFIFRAQDYLPADVAATLLEEAKAEWQMSGNSVITNEPLPLYWRKEK